jgi:hypothetical protein
MLAIDHTIFPTETYFKLTAMLLQVAKQRLTADKIARYVLETTGNQQAQSALYIAADHDADFLRWALHESYHDK